MNQLLRTALLSGIVATGTVASGLLALSPCVYAAEGDTPPSVQEGSGTDNKLVVVAGEAF